MNFDSRQIYKHLDIITGKDRNEDDIKIWLYDVVDPKECFSSYDFVGRAIPVIRDIMDRGKVPILIGGTYLYLYHLLYKVETEHIPPDLNLRQQLNKEAVNALQKKLEQIDAELYDNLNESDRYNPQRLIRKIEIARHYKKRGMKVPVKMRFVFNDFFKNNDVEIFGLHYKNKSDLQDAITMRVQKRREQGAVEEVRNLLVNGYTADDPGLQTIGYQQMIKYVKGMLTEEQAIREWITKEIQYAKRQITFMKKDPNIKWKLI